MSYTKHNFQSGSKLYASQLNQMDSQIAENSEVTTDIIPRHIPPNSEEAVSRMGKVALSYILNSDDFTYGGHSAIHGDTQPISTDDGDKWGITCSVFVSLVLFGITYEHSAYKLGNNNNILDPDMCTELELWDWFRTKWADKTGDYAFKYAFDMARWCWEHGYAFEPNEDLSNIKPGDILFMKDQIGSQGISTFRNIDHVCIFAYWKNDNMYDVWEVGSLPSVQSYYKSNLEDNAVLVARFPFAQHTQYIENKCTDNGVRLYSNSVMSSIKILDIKPDQYYTLVCKFTNTQNISQVYPAIFCENEKIATYDGALTKPENDIYVIPFYSNQHMVDVRGIINIRMLYDPNLEVKQHSTRMEWWQIVEGLHFDSSKIPSNITVSPSFEDGFTVEAGAQSRDKYCIGFSGTFPVGTCNVATLVNLPRHGNYIAFPNKCFSDGEFVGNVNAYIDYRNTTSPVIKVKNSTGESVTGAIYGVIPIFEY